MTSLIPTRDITDVWIYTMASFA